MKVANATRKLRGGVQTNKTKTERGNWAHACEAKVVVVAVVLGWGGVCGYCGDRGSSIVCPMKPGVCLFSKTEIVCSSNDNNKTRNTPAIAVFPRTVLYMPGRYLCALSVYSTINFAFTVSLKKKCVRWRSRGWGGCGVDHGQNGRSEGAPVVGTYGGVVYASCGGVGVGVLLLVWVAVGGGAR